MSDNNLDAREMLKLKDNDWRDMATLIRQLIQSDMEKGTVQEYTAQTRKTSGGAKHYSKGYKKYKDNFMNRFTDGKKLKAFSGRSVMDNNTKSVNMRVTGATIRGLHLDKILSNGVIMAYMDADGYKIEYNEEMGRLITTLSKKNQDKVLEFISNRLDKSIREWCKKEIVISTRRG